MGSIVMESEDIVAYMNGDIRHNAFKNLSTICTFANRVHCTSVFNGANPLDFSVSLLLFQLGISSGTILLFSQLLKRLGLPLIVSQILGGVVLGSFGLGHLEKFKEKVFPLRGFICLDVVSALAHIFYFFLIGLQTDISILKEIDIKAFGIGSCSTIFSVILISIYSMFLSTIVDVKYLQHIFELASLQSFISYPMVVSLLYELHLINSKFGRISLSASMASSLLKICLPILSAIRSTNGETENLASSKVVSLVMLIFLIVYVIRPATLWMAKENPIGQPLKEYFVITLILGVLVIAFCCQTFGLRIYFASFLLGFVIPSEPPIGSTLIERLEFITTWIFMPIFFVRIGLVIDNIYTIKLANLLSVSFIIFISALGKFLGSLIISMYYKFPMRDAISLGLILNSQGAFELTMFKVMKKEKLIDDEAFVVASISIMIILAIITPIIRYLLRPSKRYIVHKRRTVMHSRPEFDLCVLVCIHDQEDVPSVINLLDALNPTRRSHLIVYMLHLVELLGRAQPKLIHHKHKMVRNLRSSSSEPIINAFKYFEDSKSNIIAVNLFTAISHSTTMHDDVCSLALDKSTSLILVPFHKRYHSNGLVSFSKHKLKIFNHHILEKAPCSVALIVERGFLRVSKSIETNLQYFQIVLIFIGGPDDREAMFIGARMVGHVNINLTMIRLLDNGNVPKDDVKERRLDDEAVAEFRQILSNNYRVRYKEEVVKDGTKTISVLRSMGSNFDLIMVGRRHSPFLSPVQGLVLWNERTELGAIGEVLATSDFMGNAMILVVQQHTRVANEDQENPPETIPMDETK
ncbi:cation/H(+) antiporter 15 [Cucumis sativus]|uniref:cation/H(+) antiporter 15 n=1 Tax=Cucumis sativus TaxID=3659 RepID=UPI0002B47F06|nr:cation/H(+) antiporter 15 [Cucumis sativus]KAE8650766.1 hypothetical protein Csa_017555 [Cucumis sativus]